MTVRFKGQSEYQRSYRMPRSRSVSPQRCAPLARLCSHHMASRSHPAHRTGTKPSTPPGAQADSLPPADPGPPAGPRPNTRPSAGPQPDPGPLAGPQPDTGPQAGLQPDTRPQAGLRSDPGPPAGSRPDRGPQTGPRQAADPGPVQPAAAKPHPSRTYSQPQLSRPLTAAAVGRQPSVSEVQHALRWRAGLRSGGQRSEYHRQFSWKKPVTAASPILTAEQTIKKRKKESEKKLRPKHDVPAPLKDNDTPQVQRGHRTLTEYQSRFRSPLYRIQEEGGAMDGDTPQVKQLRQRASSYRRRAWGTNFSRDHLSQLLSEHNSLWEPTDSDPPTPHQTHHLSESCSACVEALDLVSHSSNSSCISAGLEAAEIQPAEDVEASVCGEEEEHTEEEGRLPTPRLKMLPVHRTHHDLTTPATGGALLVGKLKSSDNSSSKQRCGSAVSMAVGAGTVVDMPVILKEAWPDSNPSLLPSPDLKPAASDPPKPMRTRQRPPSPVVPPPHCIHGSLRHPDFQHNGELGLRLREFQCSGGGCGSDEDDRLSVMSWRSAASCSLASSVLERAQKRRENFWRKR